MIAAAMTAAVARAVRVRLVPATSLRVSAPIVAGRSMHACALAAARAGRAPELLAWDARPPARVEAADDDAGADGGKMFRWDGRTGSARTRGEAWQARAPAPRWRDADRDPGISRDGGGGGSGTRGARRGDDEGGRSPRTARGLDDGDNRMTTDRRPHPSWRLHGGRDAEVDLTDGRALQLDLSGAVLHSSRAAEPAAATSARHRGRPVSSSHSSASADSDAVVALSPARKRPVAPRHVADAEAAIAAAHAATCSPVPASTGAGDAGGEPSPPGSRRVYPLLSSDTHTALMAHANALCRGDVLAALRPATFNNLCELVGAVMRSGTTVGGDRVAALRLQTAVLDALEARRDVAMESRVGPARAWLGSLAAALGAYEHGLDYVTHAHSELRAHYDRMAWEQAADPVGGGKDLDVRWLFAHKSLPVASPTTVERILQPALERYAALIRDGDGAPVADASESPRSRGAASARSTAGVLDALMPALVVCNKVVDKLEPARRVAVLRPLFRCIEGEPHLAAWGRAAASGAVAGTTDALPPAHDRLMACVVIMQQLAFLRGHLAVDGAAAVRVVDDAFVAALVQGGMDALTPHLRVYVAECCLRMRTGLPAKYESLRAALASHIAAADRVFVLLDANECRKQLATSAAAVVAGSVGAVPVNVSLQNQGEATVGALFHSIYAANADGMPLMSKPQLRLAVRGATLHWHDAKHVARLTGDGLRQLCYVAAAQHRTVCAYGVTSPGTADLHEMCWEELTRRRAAALTSTGSATTWFESVAALNGRFAPFRKLDMLLREAAAPCAAIDDDALDHTAATVATDVDAEALLPLLPGGGVGGRMDAAAASPLRTATRRLMHAALSDAVARVFGRTGSTTASGTAAAAAGREPSPAPAAATADSASPAKMPTWMALDSVLAPVCALTQCVPFQASTEPWYERAAAALFDAVATHPTLAAWGSSESAVPATDDALQRLLTVLALMQSLVPLRAHIGLGGRDAFRALDAAVLCAMHQGALVGLPLRERERIAVMLADVHSSMLVSCPALWHALQPTLEAAAREIDAAVAAVQESAASGASSMTGLINTLAVHARISSRLRRVAGHSNVLDASLIRALSWLAGDGAAADSRVSALVLHVLSTVAAWGLPDGTAAADVGMLLAAAAAVQERRYATMVPVAATSTRPLAERVAELSAHRQVFDATHWLHTAAVVSTLAGHPFTPLAGQATRFVLDSLSTAGLTASMDVDAVVDALDGLTDRRTVFTTARVLSKLATTHAVAVAQGLDAASDLIPAAVRDVCVAAFSDAHGPADAAKVLLKRHHASAHGLEPLEKAASSKMEQLVVQAVAEYCAARDLPAPVWQYAMPSLRTVVDAAWPAARVVLEVDGPSHYQPLPPSQQAAELARRQGTSWDPLQYHQHVHVALLVGSPSNLGADFTRPAPQGIVSRAALQRLGWLVYRLPLERLTVPAKAQRSLRSEEAAAVLRSLTSMGVWDAIRRRSPAGAAADA